MATQTIVKMVIQFRRDTAANWELYKDVVPAAGEPCFVVDKNILKIGDGITTFENLEPIGSANIDVSADGKSIVLEDGIFKLMGFDSAKVGAQPRKTAGGYIEWVVPVDLTDAVEELQSEVDTIKKDVVALKDGSTSILSNIEGLEYKVYGAGEGTVDAKIDAKINDFANKITDDGTVNTLKELVDYVANHGSEIETLVADITTLQALVGDDPVRDQISNAINASDHITKAEVEATFVSKADAATLLGKVEAAATLEYVKYEFTDTPAGTLVDYRDKEIRVMVPSSAKFTKQTVGAGGDANSYYATFKTYVPNDNVVGYVEHLGDQVDSEILTTFSIDKYGRRYQPTWLALAKYDEATDTWNYYGKSSTVKKYIGWDYQIDWYDANGVVIASDKIRINLSNEACHSNVEPYYMGSVVKGVKVNGTLLDSVDGIVNIAIAEQTLGVKGSDEIDVADDGTLSIKQISWSKITQVDGEDVVFDGGGASGK